jgi:uncharacterized protein
VSDVLRIEVAFAAADRQEVVALKVALGATVREAIIACGVLRIFPEIDLARHRVGVFGKLVAPDAPLRDGDRVEIYRPLLADPKDVRRRRAKHRALSGKQ